MRRSLTLALALALAPASAHATTLDRVVAIAGDHVILLSEVQARAKPYVLLAAQQEKDSLALARLTTKALRETCERMIDETLVEDEANRQHVVVDDDEVDRAIASVATQNGLTLTELYREAHNQGYDAPTYRAEIRHQVLESKLAFRIAKVSDASKIEAARKQLLADLRARVYVEDRLAP